MLIKGEPGINTVAFSSVTCYTGSSFDVIVPVLFSETETKLYISLTLN